MFRTCLAIVAVLICACGNKPEPARPSLSDPAHAADLPAGSAALPSTAAAPPAQPKTA